LGVGGNLVGLGRISGDAFVAGQKANAGILRCAQNDNFLKDYMTTLKAYGKRVETNAADHALVQ
jgi:hypothetical protein